MFKRAGAADVVAVLFAVVAAVGFALLPTGSTESMSCDSSSVCTSYSGTTTLVQSDGVAVLAVLAVPVALTGLLLVSRRQSVRVALVVALGVGCLLSAMSIGLFFLPALASSVVAVVPRHAGPDAELASDARGGAPGEVG